MKNIELCTSIFRFNYKMDYLPYYKKYTIALKPDKSVLELLEMINDIEGFEFDKSGCYLKINNLFLHSDTNIGELVEKLGTTEWTIEPISKYSAKLDFMIDTNELEAKLGIFDEYLTQEQKDEYKEKYILEYYASNTLEYNREYMGDHCLLVAYDIIQENRLAQDAIAKIVKNENSGILYHTDLSHRLLEDKNDVEAKIKKLYAYCNMQIPEVEKESISTPKEIKQSFAGFNIAVYGENRETIRDEYVKASNAKYIDIVSGLDDLAINSQSVDKKFTLAIAGNILLEAKDSNSDFLVVQNDSQLAIFDKMQKKIESVVGRDIILPVITAKQFEMLLAGEKNISTLGFNKHKVKVSFLDY
jgi:hypothetical protein